jgi:flagellar basal-body rod modification protein FlgD
MNVDSTNIMGLPVNLTNAATNQSATKSIDAAETVSKDAFLQLLVAQLKNQNPLEPVKNENFLAQLATFSSLEQLVSIKEGINKLVHTTTDGTTDTTSTQTQS